MSAKLGTSAAPDGAEQLLGSVMESMDEGVVVVDKDFRLKYANKYLLNWIKRTPAEAFGRHCYKIIHDRDDICPDCAVNKTFRTRKPEYACHTGLAKDGSKTYANLSSFPIFDKKGRVVMAVEKAVDVSREKKAVDALEESEERFRLIAQNINEAFWMGDVDNEEIFYVSPAYQKLFGRTAESLYRNPRSFLDAAHPDDKVALADSVGRVKKGEPTSLEYRVLLPEGSTRWVWECRYPIREKDGRIRRFVAMAQCISQRKTTEEALSRVSRAMEQSPDLVVITNAEGLVQFVNPAFSAFSGLSRLEAVGRPLPPSFSEFGEVFSGDKEMAAVCGRRVVVHLTVSNFLDDKGRPMGTVGVGVDMTEQKRLQDKLFQSEKLVGRGTLASGIAHEINNPLTAILGMAEAIRDENDVSLIKSYVGDVIKYSLDARNIVRGLSNYSRSEGFEASSTVDVGSAMEKSLKMALHCSPLNSITVRSDLQRDCLVVANNGALQQVFVNLIVNAIHAMDHDGVLSLACRKVGDLVVATVADTGRGIPKENLKKVFDPFFTTKQAGQGTGLGLYVVYKILVKYGGDVEINSEEGIGTTFTLKFSALKSAGLN